MILRRDEKLLIDLKEFCCIGHSDGIPHRSTWLRGRFIEVHLSHRRISPDLPNCISLTHAMVDPPYRNRGVLEEFLNYLAVFAERETPVIHIQGLPTQLHNLYRRMGFLELASKPTNSHVIHIAEAWTLLELKELRKYVHDVLYMPHSLELLPHMKSFIEKQNVPRTSV